MSSTVQSAPISPILNTTAPLNSPANNQPGLPASDSWEGMIQDQDVTNFPTEGGGRSYSSSSVTQRETPGRTDSSSGQGGLNKAVSNTVENDDNLQQAALDNRNTSNQTSNSGSDSSNPVKDQKLTSLKNDYSGSAKDLKITDGIAARKDIGKTGKSASGKTPDDGYTQNSTHLLKKKDDRSQEQSTDGAIIYGQVDPTNQDRVNSKSQQDNNGSSGGNNGKTAHDITASTLSATAHTVGKGVVGGQSSNAADLKSDGNYDPSSSADLKGSDDTGAVSAQTNYNAISKNTNNDLSHVNADRLNHSDQHDSIVNSRTNTETGSDKANFVNEDEPTGGKGGTLGAQQAKNQTTSPTSAGEAEKSRTASNTLKPDLTGGQTQLSGSSLISVGNTDGTAISKDQVATSEKLTGTIDHNRVGQSSSFSSSSELPGHLGLSLKDGHKQSANGQAGLNGQGQGSNISQSADQTSQYLPSASSLDASQILSLGDLTTAGVGQILPGHGSMSDQMGNGLVSNLNFNQEQNETSAALAAIVTSLHSNGDNQITIRLDPPDLGSMTVNVSANPNGNIDVSFATSTFHAAQLIHSHIETLRNDLASAGMSLGQADVSTGGQGQGQGSNYNQNSQNQNNGRNQYAPDFNGEGQELKQNSPILNNSETIGDYSGRIHVYA